MRPKSMSLDKQIFYSLFGAPLCVDVGMMVDGHSECALHTADRAPETHSSSSPPFDLQYTTISGSTSARSPVSGQRTIRIQGSTA